MRRQGFGVMEVIVVIVILLIFAAIGAMLLLRSNTQARKTECLRRMKTLTLGCHSVLDRMGSFPPGFPTCTLEPSSPFSPLLNQGGIESGITCAGPNWQSQILPEINQRSVFEDLVSCSKRTSNSYDDCNTEEFNFIGRTVWAELRCPSSGCKIDSTFSGAGLTDFAKGNFAACWGNKDYAATLDRRHYGAFGLVPVKDTLRNSGSATPDFSEPQDWMKGEWKLGLGQGRRERDFIDGTSHTVFISEVVSSDNGGDLRGGWALPMMGASLFTGQNTPNSKTPDSLVECPPEFTKENAPFACQKSANSGAAFATARSWHQGGVNISKADGSVQFITNEVDAHLWRNLTAAQDASN